jgi:hypothetical protein
MGVGLRRIAARRIQSELAFLRAIDSTFLKEAPAKSTKHGKSAVAPRQNT